MNFRRVLLVGLLLVVMTGTVSAGFTQVLDDAESGSVTDFWIDAEGDGLNAQYENQFSDSQGDRSLNLEYSSSDFWQSVHVSTEKIRKRPTEVQHDEK